MKRPALLVFGLLLAGLAFAGVIHGDPGGDLRPTVRPIKLVIHGDPGGDLRPASRATASRPITAWRPIERRPRPAPSLHGAVTGLVAIPLDGAHFPLTLDGPLDLSGPLPLPAGPVAELVAVLDGPVTLVSFDGRILDQAELSTLTLPLSDPDTSASAVRIELPEAWDDLAELLDGAVLVD